MKNLIEITDDVLSIVWQIKSVDSAYHVFFNCKKNRFELYSKVGFEYRLEVVCPYEKLDNRFLLKVKMTRKEYAEQMLKKMEEENQKLCDDEQKKLLDESQIKSKEMMEYADKKSQDIDFSNAYQNQWI